MPSPRVRGSPTGCRRRAGWQTAIYLARSARSVTLLVRGQPGQEHVRLPRHRDRRYPPGVHARLHTEVAAARGDHRLTELVLRGRATDRDETLPTAALFVMIGATPHTDWLPRDVARDRHGNPTGSVFRKH